MDKLKEILFQIVYFVLLLGSDFIFHARYDGGMECSAIHESGTVEIMFDMLLFLGLSAAMCVYILRRPDRMIRTSVRMGLTLWLLFEIYKLIEYRSGFLPHYGDVPLIINLSLSLVAVFAYMCILYVICRYYRKTKSRGCQRLLTGCRGMENSWSSTGLKTNLF